MKAGELLTREQVCRLPTGSMVRDCDGDEWTVEAPRHPGVARCRRLSGVPTLSCGTRSLVALFGPVRLVSRPGATS